MADDAGERALPKNFFRLGTITKARDPEMRRRLLRRVAQRDPARR